MQENTFWLSLWGIVAVVILAIVSISLYSSYATEQRDLDFTKQGLQPYTQAMCIQTRLITEWHEPGWQPPQSTK